MDANMTVMAAEVVSLMPKPPKDKFLLTWSLSFLLGVGILLPWNIFITESRYFDTRVHEPPYPPLLANNFESLFAAVYQGSSCATLTLLVAMRGKIKDVYRVLIPLVVRSLPRRQKPFIVGGSRVTYCVCMVSHTRSTTKSECMTLSTHQMTASTGRLQ